jgi:probable HAF family extracellular repeat protein
MWSLDQPATIAKSTSQTQHKHTIMQISTKQAVSLCVTVIILAATLQTADAATPPYTIIDLGSLGGENTIAFDLNDHEQVVGMSQSVEGAYRPFIWQNGVMKDLGGPEAECVAAAINNRGHVVGSCNGIPMLWKNGGWTTLPSLGGRTGGEDISENGIIVGGSETPTGEMHAVMWKDGIIIDLGTLGGTFSVARSVNERGQIAGDFLTATSESRAFLYENGRMRTLGNLGDMTHSPVINKRGHILVYADGMGLLLRGVDTADPIATGIMTVDLNDSGAYVGHIDRPTNDATANYYQPLIVTRRGTLELPLGPYFSGMSEALNNEGVAIDNPCCVVA